MTHHSTAIEGNLLSKHQTEKCIDQFAEDISSGVGILNPGSIDPAILMGMPLHDVVEVVNHAACLEYTRKNFFQPSITEEGIQRMHSILMPSSPALYSMAEHTFRSDQGVYRRIPVKVRGSPTVRPYPQEVPALMKKILDIYYNRHLQEMDPIVASVLLMMNFLFVHPFHDGNGRVSRLLLQVLLHQHGVHGCIIPVQDKAHFFGHMTPYFANNEVDGMVRYIADRIMQFHSDLHRHEVTKQTPAFD
jgi:Fic family protein